MSFTHSVIGNYRNKSDVFGTLAIRTTSCDTVVTPYHTMWF